MTPTKNYASEYSSNNYSPSRNTGGCRECASSSAQLRHRSYSRPLTGNPLMRSTNYPSYNINRDLFNSKDTINRYRNVDDNDSDFTLKKIMSSLILTKEMKIIVNLIDIRVPNLMTEEI